MKDRTEYLKEYYIKNKSKILERQREYNLEHVEQRIQYQKEYNKNNREALNDYQRNYYYKIHDKMLSYQREYNNNNKERIKEYQKEYYVKRKEKTKKKEKVQRSLIPLPKYLLDKIEAVLKRKLKEYNKLKEEEREQKEEILVVRVENKYNEKKKMMKYQYSLPQAEPFSEFINTEKGFLLKW